MERTLKTVNQLRLTLTNTPQPGDRSHVHEQIKAYNDAVSQPHRAARIGGIQPLAVFLRNGQGDMLAGLSGDTYWGWLEVDDLWVTESLRGQGWGRELLLTAETEAIVRGCTQAFLSTFSFQARGFYEKLGYRVVGQLAGYPPGQTYYWMRKDFGRPAEHVSFRSVTTDDDVLAYLAQINRDHPARPLVIDQIETQIAKLPFDAPHVVELCFGPGMLARHLLSKLPLISYTGLDLSGAFTRFAQKQLAPFANRATLLQADLNGDAWPGLLSGDMHAMVSLQSLHDLGGEAEVSRIYHLAGDLLVPGGLLLNADLTAPEQQPMPNNPGRLSIARHLYLLRAYGFKRVECTLTVDDFGCVTGING